MGSHACTVRHRYLGMKFVETIWSVGSDSKWIAVRRENATRYGIESHAPLPFHGQAHPSIHPYFFGISHPTFHILPFILFSSIQSLSSFLSSFALPPFSRVSHTRLFFFFFFTSFFYFYSNKLISRAYVYNSLIIM